MSINYNRSGDIIEILERDATGAKVGSWKFNVNDKKLANSIFAYILKKYNFKPEISPYAKPKEDGSGIDLDVKW